MKRKACGLALFGAAMLGFAVSAGAVDGTIEINQAKVLAAGGFPYVIGASGSYRLTGNLSVAASKDAIDVNDSSVTIDLNGFSITGPGSSAPIGINASAVFGVSVENGTVDGFNTGLQLGGQAIVRNVHADADTFGIVLGAGSLIQGCTATGDTQYGIRVGGATVISGNTVNGGNNGISCNGSGCLITYNSIDNNSGAGISANDSTTAYGWNVLNGDLGGISGGTSMAGKNTNSCGGTAC